MTEQEWLNALPEPMLEFMRGKATERKLRLVALACCRSVWDLLTHSSSRRAVELQEALVDQEGGSKDDWQAVKLAAQAGFQANLTPACQAARSPRSAACAAAFAVVQACGDVYFPERACYQSVNAATRLQFGTGPTQHAESVFRARSALLRDIFGNPFRPVTIDEAVRVHTAVSQLAEAIYQDRAIDRLPILADALEEAGCRDEALLAHCREPGAHARGCWVLDLLLAKK